MHWTKCTPYQPPCKSWQMPVIRVIRALGLAQVLPIASIYPLSRLSTTSSSEMSDYGPHTRLKSIHIAPERQRLTKITPQGKGHIHHATKQSPLQLSLWQQG